MQTFNNPLTTFKTETFIVLMVIAWTYLLHAHYRERGVEYRYHIQGPKRKRFCHPRPGEYRYWDLAKCLRDAACPLDTPTKNNLLFLIGLRNQIEHHGSAGVGEAFTARYVACCLNYEREVTRLFGPKFSIGTHMTYSLPLRELTSPAPAAVEEEALPKGVERYVRDFDNSIPSEDFQHDHFAYRLTFERRVANNAAQADKVIEFINADSDAAESVDKERWAIKDRERPKYLFGRVRDLMHQEGFVKFNQHHHTTLWKQMDARKPGKGYGVMVGNTWYWYEPWVEEVRRHCETNRASYIES